MNTLVVGAIQLGATASDQHVHRIITSGTHRLAFSQGSKVFVAINNDDSAWVLRDVVVGLASPEDAYQELSRVTSLFFIALAPSVCPLNADTYSCPPSSQLHPTGEGQLVHLQPDPSSGLARLCPLTIAPRSASGIMVV
ncbi:uncharacterized protein PGTG_13867 [Puccinia graminis f. sp. tritici CRL 75-36-700-3]|uniref:Uncharacterized protein n=1 Tax=Puccinia graminis f. sp. tritici (strain CRL 75-36-700-3 / race SCCL) TaxID=418459 RepID=E3KT71_PUCGT|nr:uncharacterized protein PGTG_13867 [Puccinia graminis f. sp. tritici CRL 75-36-700-3]EFP87496.2 hypothetical protein PGTG_13867 [Puccinia graminis f. sp. tritici CRL 75-36-700-3]